MKKILLFLIICFLSAFCLRAATNQFAKPSGSKLRICAYNVMQQRVWLNANGNPNSRYHAFARMLNGVKADIWMLNEMFYGANGWTEADANAFMDRVRSVTGQNDWKHSWDKEGRFTMTRYNIVWEKTLHRRTHATWIDLPSSVSSKDILVISVHWKTDILGQATQTKEFVRQVRAGTYSAKNIPTDITIVVSGDYNAGRGSGPYRQIYDEGYIDPVFKHIGSDEVNTLGSAQMSNGELVSVSNNAIDHMLYDSDVLVHTNQFIHNTLHMPQNQLDQYGMKRGDVAVEPEKNQDWVNGKIACDHFAVVADFAEGSLPPPPPPPNDTDNPVVSFNTPVNGTEVEAGTNLYFKVDASDSSGISRVYLYKDGVQLSRTEGGAPYEWGAENQNDPEIQNMQPGIYFFKARAEDNHGKSTEVSITITVAGTEPPPLPPPVEGSIRIEAEDFDNNVGFGTQATSDVGGGLNIKQADIGDYLEYNLNIVNAGTYDAVFRVSSFSKGAKFDLKNGNTILCSVDEPATGDYQIFTTTAAQSIDLPAGNVTLTISATGSNWNMNWFELTESAVVDPYEAWKTSNNVSDDMADDDNDGIKNIMEYALGGNPKSANSGQRPSLSRSTNSVDISFNRAEATVTYIIEKSTDLINWSDHIVVNDSHGAVGSQCSVPVALSEMNKGKLFLRLKIEN